MPNASLAVLEHLALAGPLTIGEASAHLCRAQSVVSEIVSHLQRQGMLERESDPADRRRTLIWLTPAGHAALHRQREVLSADLLADALSRMGCGYGDGGGLIGSSTVWLGGLHYSFQAVALPDLRKEPEQGEGWVRFTQTAGGRTGVPMPRRVRRRPYLQWNAPLVWTTLSLTLHADGRAEPTLAGASRFPRHWVYDAAGQLSAKSGLTDFRNWWRTSFGRHTPWGDQDSPALVTTVETALERALSAQLMHGAARPQIRRVKPGTVIVGQGEPGTEVYLILDGVVRVEQNGERLAEYGPGVLLGERAHLEGGARTSSVTAVTACRTASADAGQFDRAALQELAGSHWREGEPGRVR